MNEMTNDKNRVWLLLSRKVSGSMSPEESFELDKLLEQNPDAWYTLEVLNAMGEMQNIPPELVDEIHALLQGNTPNNEELPIPTSSELTVTVPKTKKSKWTKISLVVCAVLAVVMIGGYYWRGYVTDTAPPHVALHEISATNGSQISHILPDGTKIRLNAGSKITYPKNYATAPTREIHLIGEGYFDVAHDKQRPFAVHTPTFTIHNIGTAFNVKAYPDDPTSEATLIEGAIEIVLQNKPNESIVMKPNQKIVFYNERTETDDFKAEDIAAPPHREYQLTTIVPDSKTNEIVETAWMDNKIIFKNEIFGELAKKLERRFNVNIVVQDDNVLRCPMTGSFKDESLAECLETLQLICKFNYSIKDNVVYITH